MHAYFGEIKAQTQGQQRVVKCPRIMRNWQNQRGYLGKLSFGKIVVSPVHYGGCEVVVQDALAAGVKGRRDKPRHKRGYSWLQPKGNLCCLSSAGVIRNTCMRVQLRWLVGCHHPSLRTGMQPRVRREGVLLESLQEDTNLGE